MIYSFIIVRKSTTLVFHKRIDLNMEGILVQLLLPPQILSTHTHPYFSFPHVSEEHMHQYVEPLQPNVLKRILITMNALINGTLMTMLILKGSNRIQCILSSYILNIASVRLLQFKPYHRC